MNIQHVPDMILKKKYKTKYSVFSQINVFPTPTPNYMPLGHRSVWVRMDLGEVGQIGDRQHMDL